jgi:hypothetical protein
MSTNFILTDEQSSNHDSQLAFDFSSVPEAAEKTAGAVQLAIPSNDNQNVSIPHLNTPDNFVRNFTAISGDFESDTVEAARHLLRVMSKPDRKLALNNMRLAGCSDRESYHNYLMNILQTEHNTPSNKKNLDNEKLSKIVKEFKAGLIDENTAKYRLRTEVNYPIWIGADQLLQTKPYLDWQAKLERHNNRKYDFINTLPLNEHLNAGEWLGNRKYLFNGESKSIGNYINEQMDLKTLTVTSGGVNGYNLGKYGGLFAQYLINSLQAEQAVNESLQNPETVQFRPFGAWTDFNSRLSLPERERLNKESLSILEKAEKEQLSGADKAILRRYSGFGGIPATDERGVLYDYYTSPPAARLVWKLLEKSEIINSGDRILEPSCGTGVFFEYAPKDRPLQFTGVELDKRTARIAGILHSSENTEILNMSFEAFNLSSREKEFDCVIGNAPFGARSFHLLICLKKNLLTIILSQDQSTASKTAVLPL